MISELMFGTYLFFLLCGVGLGLLIGYVIGYQGAVVEYHENYDLDDEDDDDSVLSSREVE